MGLEAAMAEAIIISAASSIWPCASLAYTLCLLAAASVGSGQLKYWSVAWFSSSITSSRVGMGVGGIRSCGSIVFLVGS